MPPPARTLLGGLLCERDRRLGRGGERDFWDQPLFEGLQWGRLRQQEAPFAPISYGAADTSNFDLPEGGSGATVRDLGSMGSVWGRRVYDGALGLQYGVHHWGPPTL